MTASRGRNAVVFHPLVHLEVHEERACSEAFARIENVTIVPIPPQTAMFHVLVRAAR